MPSSCLTSGKSQSHGVTAGPQPTSTSMSMSMSSIGEFASSSSSSILLPELTHSSSTSPSSEASSPQSSPLLSPVDSHSNLKKNNNRNRTVSTASASSLSSQQQLYSPHLVRISDDDLDDDDEDAAVEADDDGVLNRPRNVQAPPAILTARAKGKQRLSARREDSSSVVISRKSAIQRHAADLVRREAKALLDLAAKLDLSCDDEYRHDDLVESSDDHSDDHDRSPDSGQRIVRSPAFARAVEVLHSMDKHGKIILTGIGKSGLLARKAVATFNSLGTPAVFLHPVEALHGDMGVVSPYGIDTVIMISYSGRTQELLTLASWLRARRVRSIISVTTPRSLLGNASDITLDATVDAHEEADTSVPAPTSSVMVALALLDSLALSILRLRTGWDDDKAERRHAFAANHPGGSLGQRLATEV